VSESSPFKVEKSAMKEKTIIEQYRGEENAANQSRTPLAM
jgi:hypothetical protein